MDNHLRSSSLYRPLFLWSLPFTFLYFGLPIFSKELGASAIQIGGLFSAFTATTLILRPAVGWAIDRYGRKVFFVLALLIYAISMGVFAFASSLSSLYLARILQGTGSALLWTATYTIVADLTTTSGRGREIGKINQTTTRGGLVGVLAGAAAITFLPHDLGWKVSFAAFAVLTFLAAVLAMKNVPDTKPKHTARRGKTLVSGLLIKLLIVVFITGVPEAMLSPIYLIYLQDKFSTDIMTLAWAFFPAGLVAAFLSAQLGALSDRYGRTPIMAVGLFGAGVISLLMPGLPSLVWLAMLYTLSAIMWGLSEPAETALIADITGTERHGLGYGLYDFVESLGFSIGPLLGGLLYDVIGRDIPFYLNGAILIISAVWVFLFLRQAGAISHVNPTI